MSDILINPQAKNTLDIPPPPLKPLAYHRKLPDYAPSPLHHARKISDELGVGSVLVKDESNRFGLPAFKVLGASWAVYRLIQLRLGIKDEDWKSVDDLKERLRINNLLSLITATDGNHGCGVARVARWLGFGARIFLPQDTVEARVEAIRSEGAHVTIIEGDYNKTVEEASDHNGPVDWLIQDTAWPGNERIPGWIVEGYSTIFHELEEQVRVKDVEGRWKRGKADLIGEGPLIAEGGEEGECVPDVIIVQIGVGSLAASVVQYYKNRERRESGKRTPIVIGVEADGAACAFESVKAGKLVTIHEKEPTIMAGLNCGLISYTAWPLIRDGIDAFVTVGDERAREALRLLQEAGIESGESGGAGLAGLLEMQHHRQVRELLASRGIGGGFEEASVLLISTEGITDPEMYQQIIGGAKGI